MKGDKKPEQLPYEISERVARQARTEPSRLTTGGPSVRPLQIFTLDPSVSYRLGGVATVDVPYEELEPGPKGRLFDVQCRKVPAPLAKRFTVPSSPNSRNSFGRRESGTSPSASR
jgi:hypothetical protein